MKFWPLVQKVPEGGGRNSLFPQICTKIALFFSSEKNDFLTIFFQFYVEICLFFQKFYIEQLGFSREIFVSAPKKPVLAKNTPFFHVFPSRPPSALHWFCLKAALGLRQGAFTPFLRVFKGFLRFFWPFFRLFWLRKKLFQTKKTFATKKNSCNFFWTKSKIFQTSQKV